MSYISIEKLMQGRRSLYKLVLGAATRANEILEGDHPLVITDSKKHTTIALEEISKGKLIIEEGDDNV